ncbi:hypothetical protein MFIFM68171_09868 [Madurella fahalii]|uniref:MFS transporter n=1 Tax=Madurella fahalii TaxID=1157608 RepID=A0ABQ0GPI9_9PEZI
MDIPTLSNTQSDSSPSLTLPQLAAICFTAFTTGLNNLSPIIRPTPPTAPATHPLFTLTLLSTSTGYSLGAILAAATILPRILQASASRPRAGLRACWWASTLSALALAGGVPLPAWQGYGYDYGTGALWLVALATASSLLLGAAGCVNLAVAGVLCAAEARARRSSAAAAVGVVHGLAALGVVGGAVVRWGRGGHLAMLGGAVVNGGCLGLAARGGGLGPEKGGKGLHGTSPRMDGWHGFPPPASRCVILGALFAFSYQAVAVITPFLVVSALGLPVDRLELGYVGFWAGISVGRMRLCLVAQHVGERQSVFAALVLVPSTQIACWLMPDGVGSVATVAAVTGLLLGPVYPCALAVCIRGMAEPEEASGMGIITAFGATGGASALVVTGFVAGATGHLVLQAIASGLFGVMLLCWYALPEGLEAQW